MSQADHFIAKKNIFLKPWKTGDATSNSLL